MRTNRLVFRTALAAVAITALGCANDNTGEKNTSDSVKKPEPVKVLVRRRNNSTLALDGVIFQLNLMTAMLKHEPLSDIELTGNEALVVEEESTAEMRSPADNKVLTAPSPWTRDPAAYAYVIDWTLNSIEKTKTSIDGDLVINVSEEWKIEKPSDASVSKSWKSEYVLKTGKMKRSNDEDVSVAAELIRSVIAPARAPILREIRSIIGASLPGQDQPK